MRLALLLEYDGREFAGWQLQPEQRTVQGELESALATLWKDPVRVEAAGRTDAGVHARGQVVAIDAPRGVVDAGRLRRSLNGLTGPDLAVREVVEAPARFDPRRDAASRTYVYRVWSAPYRPALDRDFVWAIPEPLDGDAMRAAGARLEGEHDFSAFRAAACTARNPVRRLERLALDRSREEWRMTFTANAFLHHMVRNLVGTLVEAGRGRLGPGDVESILRSRDRSRAPATAPPHGLCLERVDYPPELDPFAH